jgi:hypothetical protein
MPRLATVAIIILLLACSARAENDNLSIAGFDGEPSLAVNPANPLNMIAGWMRLRLDGRVAIATRATTDGGTTWSPMQFMPHMDSAYGSADVCMAFHRSGMAYIDYVDYRTAPDTVGGVYVARSTDGGLSWNTPVLATSSKDVSTLPIDRPWMAIDNSGTASDGTVYLTSMTAYWQPTPGHHVYVRRSTDNGATWGALNQIDSVPYSIGALTAAYASPSVGSDGRLYIVYWTYDTTVSRFLRIACATSLDGGASFSRSIIATAAVVPGTKFLYTYALAAQLDSAGQAVIAWVDARFGDVDVVAARTTDGGVHWSNPVRINDDARGTGVVQDRVWLASATNGRIAAAWRDRRNGGAGFDAAADIYASISHDGGASFGANIRMSDSTAPNAALPCCNSFVGVGIASDTVHVDWGDDRTGDWNVHYARAAASTNAVVERTRVPSPYIDVYPMPAQGPFTVVVRGATKGPVHARLVNAAGKVIADQQMTKGLDRSDAGGPSNQRTAVLVPPPSLPAGAYELQLIIGDTVEWKSVVVVK